MKRFGIALFLLAIVFPASLLAQQGGAATGGATAGGAAAGGGTTNLSSQGGFIGVSSVGFVGIDEIYIRATTRAASATRQTVAARPRTPVASAATQRRATTALGTGQLGSLGNRAIRSATSLDADLISAGPSMQRPLTTIETNLGRIQGIQGSQVELTSSPVGTTAVLTGTVASDRERRVAQQFLLMEPGINRVQNLLEVR